MQDMEIQQRGYMMSAELKKKLRIAEDLTMQIIGAPEGYIEQILPLPDGAVLNTGDTEEVDFVQLFVGQIMDLERDFDNVLQVLTYDGLLWVTYPKQSSKIKSDLNRDILVAWMEARGYTPATLISIDNTWSAMRLRPIERKGAKKN